MIGFIIRAVFAALILLSVSCAMADDAQWDPKLTRGTLDNGLNYVLYDSGRPEDPFNIRLIVHAGSVDEDQPSGIAHMLEHMVFQTTEAHPEGMHRYIQSIGWRQGVQVNAVTRESETQYMVRTRPHDALDLVGSLAFTADLAFGAELRADDWSRERSIILEELRQGDSVADRISRRKKAALRVGSRYVERSTIGTRQSIETASIKDIRAFYDRFYVASNMTLIVSGHIDKASAEAAIKRLFGTAPKRPKPDRSYVDLPLKNGLSVGMVQDSAGTSSQTTFAFRMAMPDRTSEDGQFAYLQKYLLTRLIRDAIRDQEPHYAKAVKSMGFVAQETTEHRLILAFSAGGQEHDSALKVVLEVIERLRRNGIDADRFEKELAAARRVNESNIAAAANRTYAEWEDRIASAVLIGSVVDDPAARSARTRKLLDCMRLADLERRMREMLSTPDQVLFYQAPGSVQLTLPTVAKVEEMRDALSGMEKLPALPPVEKIVEAPEAPAPRLPSTAVVANSGSIISERRLKDPEIIEWSLSNSDRVVWLVRDTPDHKVYLSGQTQAGFDNAEFGSLVSQTAIQLWTQSGYRFWTQDEYERWKKAQPAGLAWSYALNSSVLNVAGVASPEMLPELFKRYAMDVAFGDVREEAMEEVRDDLVSLDHRPDDFSRLLYGEVEKPGAEQLASMTADRLSVAARALLAQPVHWFVVGPAPTDETRGAFAQRIGSVARAHALTPAPALQRQGYRVERVSSDRPDRSQVRISFFTPLDWTPEASFLASALTPVTQQALKNELRYELGGVYTLKFELELDAATNRAIGTLSFYCAPGREEELADAAVKVLAGMPGIAAGTDTARIKADIDFAETGRLADPNTWLRRLALSYRRYGDAEYLQRMHGLSRQLTNAVFAAQAKEIFKTSNLALSIASPGGDAQEP
ncbi:insulinase family protein (plasmid) [Rhizobium grahamii]|uniref:Insulinase family protein n=1 Tax=Rhizobium grahamii TaxID=1120045 RepID=A0A5Q0CEZ7_9HYPH|nr:MULTISPECIES: pitrilysin family protein [Rhizobium]QFY62531.1 insulinase family protein [Rhizobium grahamii]QRM52727.1 insulinase family protein [Rhizobium sp. BG6]